MPTLQLTEARFVGEARAIAGKPGRFLVQLIDPGWGTSGYYSPEVLEAAGKGQVFPAGTQMYLDHPTESEEYERPERSLRDLAAVLTENAYWDGSALVAEAAVFGAYREVLAEMKDAIGVSIRASAKVTEGGTAEGRRGRIIDELVEAQSVDFVTKAGRGGKVLQVLESARANLVEARNIGDWVESRLHLSLTQIGDDMFGDGRLTRDERIAMSSAVGAGLDAFHNALSSASPALYERDPWADPDQLTATAGEATTNPEESVMTTSPEGAAAATEAADTAPDGQEATATAVDEAVTPTDSGATTAPVAAAETAETTPPTIEENHMTENAGAGGAAPLGSPRQVLEARMKAQSDQIAQLVAKDRARDIIGEELAEAWVADSTKARLRSVLIQDLPLVENALDEQALRTRCVEARDAAELEAAETLNAAGVGTPRGLGAMTTSSGGDAAKYGDALKESLKTLGLSESETDIAVKGR